jgi:hypothetical protein
VKKPLRRASSGETVISLCFILLLNMEGEASVHLLEAIYIHAIQSEVNKICADNCTVVKSVILVKEIMTVL